MAVSESQRRANKKWRENHPERSNYLSKRSTARNFISQYGTLSDVEDLQTLVDDRLTNQVESDVIESEPNDTQKSEK